MANIVKNSIRVCISILGIATCNAGSLQDYIQQVYNFLESDIRAYCLEQSGKNAKAAIIQRYAYCVATAACSYEEINPGQGFALALEYTPRDSAELTYIITGTRPDISATAIAKEQWDTFFNKLKREIRSELE